MNLTLTDIGVVLPPGRARLADWSQAAQAHRGAGASEYRDVIDLMYAPTHVDLRGLLAKAEAGEAHFPCAGRETQADLALAAVRRLADGSAPDILLYAATSIDERIFRSSVAWLAGETGMSAIPHFGVGQLQGASLAGGLAMVAALLMEEHASHVCLTDWAGDMAGRPSRSAILVAAEKWPLPCPRQFMAGTVLGDVAVALRVSTQDDAGGLRVVSWANSSFAPFLSASDGAIDIAALEAAVITTLADLLAPLDRGDILMLPSGLGHALDARVASAYGIGCWEPADADGDAVDYGAAAMPVAMARAFAAVRHAEVAEGTLLLAWGAGPAGAVGALLVTAAAGRA